MTEKLDHSFLRCAHISDLHFSDLTWKFSYLFSKKWLGYFNLLFKRRCEYTASHFPLLINLLKQMNVSHVFISGDLSSISANAEFSKARRFLSLLQEEGFQVFVLPGNHDNYTRSVAKNRLFYQFFKDFFPSDVEETLETHGVAAHRLNPHWWIVGLDTAIPTSLISSCGLFSTTQEDALRCVLKKIPQSDAILLMNHYPFFQNDSPRKILKRGKALQQILKENSNIRLYLHGHTHRHELADLRASQLPIILDSGSLSHVKRSSWNFLELKPHGCCISPCFQNASQEHWKVENPISIAF